jgi:hypothetical protein
MQNYIALTCSALARSIYAASAHSPHTVSVQLFDQGLHNTPGSLRELLQAGIDAVEPCDAVLLAYGICGRSTIGLIARESPLVIPRAHDCVTLYLGSSARYQEEFDAEPGTYWYSVDYMERSNSNAGLGASMLGVIDNLYEEYVEKYGQDNADYLMEVMGEWGKHYKRAVFIDTGLGDGATFEQAARDQAQARGWAFERKTGNRRLIEMLVNGDWKEDEFLVVPPGHRLEQTSEDGLMRAVPVDGDAE